ncbi:MAG TPA: formate/nitrite transporter family protein [Candidatus Elarobacter sp.]|jgi:formate/nitrite transporter FocA (FNT family)
MSAGTPIKEEEVEEVEKRQRPRSAVIYETIRREGEEELQRGSLALFWSAIAAGGSMSFSLITMGVLQSHLPDTPWRPLVSSMGYTLGFMIVILGRQQLFTENTLTPLLPMLYEPTVERLRNILRLWAVVLTGNLIAACAAAALIAFSGAFPDQTLKAFDEIARTTALHPFLTLLAKGIFAGWLIALMVWLLPMAENLGLFVILILTYVVGAAELSHIIAGSVDAMYGAWRGVVPWSGVVAFAVPTLLGNCVGGISFVAAVSSAEITADDKDRAA